MQRFAGALATLGVRRGERVAFLSRNRPELAIAEGATLHLGAAGVVLYAASPPTMIEHVLRDSEPLLLLVESELDERLAEVRHAVPQTLVLDGAGNGQGALASIAAPTGFDFEAAWRAVQPDDLAGILYTSGTTGLAKGVQWTHRGTLGSHRSGDAVIGGNVAIHDIAYGSMANIGERSAGHWYSFTRGSTRTICRDPSQLGAALGEARPTRLLGPPLVWLALQRALEQSLAAEERVVLERAVQRVRTATRGEAASPSDGAEQALLAKLRARIGLDRISKAVSSAAPCPMAVHEHYRALGIDFQEFYAGTEFGIASAHVPAQSISERLAAPRRATSCTSPRMARCSCAALTLRAATATSRARPARPTAPTAGSTRATDRDEVRCRDRGALRLKEGQRECARSERGVAVNIEANST